MKFQYQCIVVIVLLIGFTLPSPAQDSPVIHDAVFSPDGLWLGVATDAGAGVYERDTWVLQHHFSFGKPVRFLRWSPDSARLLAVYDRTPDEAHPSHTVCAVVDIASEEVLLEITEPVRWFGYGSYIGDSYYEDQFPMRVNDVPTIRCSHPNMIAFSNNGSLVAYIDVENRVRVWNVDSNTVFKTITPTDDFLLSIGFPNDSGKLWLGARFGKVFVVDLENGDVVDTKQLRWNGNDAYEYPLDVSPDLNFIVCGGVFYPIGVSTDYSINLYDQNGDHIRTIVSAVNYDQQRVLMHRIQYRSNNALIGIKHGNTSDDFLAVVSGASVSANRAFAPLLSIPLQPFSPDGKEFLLFMDTERNEKDLYIVRVGTFQMTKLSLEQARVNAFELY